MKKLKDYFGATKVADVLIEMKAIFEINEDEFYTLTEMLTEKQFRVVCDFVSKK